VARVALPPVGGRHQLPSHLVKLTPDPPRRIVKSARNPNWSKSLGRAQGKKRHAVAVVCVAIIGHDRLDGDAVAANQANVRAIGGALPAANHAYTTPSMHC
jgi:hypothetical protein